MSVRDVGTLKRTQYKLHNVPNTINSQHIIYQMKRPKPNKKQRSQTG